MHVRTKRFCLEAFEIFCVSHISTVTKAMSLFVKHGFPSDLTQPLSRKADLASFCIFRKYVRSGTIRFAMPVCLCFCVYSSNNCAHNELIFVVFYVGDC